MCSLVFQKQKLTLIFSSVHIKPKKEFLQLFRFYTLKFKEFFNFSMYGNHMQIPFSKNDNRGRMSHDCKKYFQN